MITRNRFPYNVDFCNQPSALLRLLSDTVINEIYCYYVQTLLRVSGLRGFSAFGKSSD